MPDLGRRVRRYREERGYSLSDLARQSGVSRSFLYQIESGQSSPTEEKLTAIAGALGVDVADLLGVNVAGDPIPESLRQFAEQARLPEADIRMLARINYRGRQPTTAEAWRILYSVVKSSAGEP